MPILRRLPPMTAAALGLAACGPDYAAAVAKCRDDIRAALPRPALRTPRR
jgi:hypothetical protein